MDLKFYQLFNCLGSKAKIHNFTYDCIVSGT